MGPTPIPTPTRTLGMRPSCNFVNVYTIVYHVQYTYTCTRAHPQRTSSREKACASDKCPRTLSASWTGRVHCSRPTAVARRRAGHADFRARILARKSVKKSVSVPVSVSVSVPWNLSLCRCVSLVFARGRHYGTSSSFTMLCSATFAVFIVCCDFPKRNAISPCKCAH